MSNTRTVTGTQGSRHRRLHVSYETSAADTELTVTTPIDKTRVRRLVAVHVKYSSGVTKNVVVTYDASHGSGYDTDIQTIALTAVSSGSWIPQGDYLIAPLDAIKVVAPSHGAGGTSAVTVTTEEL